jgi:hypothetical protein
VRAIADAICPNGSAESLALLDRLLPDAEDPETPVQGMNARGPLPELLSQQVPASARPNPSPA